MHTRGEARRYVLTMLDGGLPSSVQPASSRRWAGEKVAAMGTTVVRCDRCGRRMGNGEDWNVAFSVGNAAGYLCPDCQTNDESLEAQVDEVLTDYSGWCDVAGEEALEVIAADIEQRVELAVWNPVEALASGGAPATIDEMVEVVARRVEAGLPAHYPPANIVGCIIREDARDIIQEGLAGTRGDSEN